MPLPGNSYLREMRERLFSYGLRRTPRNSTSATGASTCTPGNPYINQGIASTTTTNSAETDGSTIPLYRLITPIVLSSR
jgi:hypothetical protein